MDTTLSLTSFKDFCNYVNVTFTAHFFYMFLKFLVIPCLMAVAIYFMLHLLLGRFFQDKLTHQKEDLEQYINNFLTDLIFSEYDFTATKEKIDNFKKTDIYKHKWCRYIILNKLIHIKQNIKEVNQNLILTIYKQFGLNIYSQNLIRRRKWYFKSVGFYHYQSLDYKIKKSQIKPYLDHKNKYLKSSALIALIALSDEKFDILKNYTQKISSADEFKILDLIYQKKSSIPEHINLWLESANASIVILALKLIIRYRETIQINKITYLLLHPDHLVRNELIFAIRELCIFDAKEILQNHYAKETIIKNKISVLKTLAIIGDQKTENFIANLLTDENNIELKFQIIRALNTINKSYFDGFYPKNQEEDIMNKIILHVKNPILN